MHHITFATKTDMRKTITFSKAGTSYIARRLQEERSLLLKRFFMAAGATTNENDDSYSLNGIKDITEEQMLAIYMHKDAVKELDMPHILQGCNIRTIIPGHQAAGMLLKNRPLNGEESFAESNLEILKFGNRQDIDNTDEKELLPATEMRGTFRNCKKLHTIYPINMKNVSAVSDDTFAGCDALHEVRLYGLGTSLNLGCSPMTSYNSLLYAVTNSSGEELKIALHPTTYKYLIGMIAAPTYVGGTECEWYALHTKAANRNIKFVTEEKILFVKNDTIRSNHIAIEDDAMVIANESGMVSGTTMILHN